MTVNTLFSSTARGIARWLDSTWVFWALLAATLAFFAPRIDGYLRPAVSAFTVDLARSERVGDAVYLRGAMVKNRCEFVGVKVTGYTQDAEVKLPILFQDNEHDQTANRPTGPQQFGPWRVLITPPPDVWGISLQASHICGAGIFTWTIFTDLGPIVVLDSLGRSGPSSLAPR